MLSEVLNFMILASHLQNMDPNLSSILSYHKKKNLLHFLLVSNLP